MGTSHTKPSTNNVTKAEQARLKECYDTLQEEFGTLFDSASNLIKFFENDTVSLYDENTNTEVANYTAIVKTMVDKTSVDASFEYVERVTLRDCPIVAEGTLSRGAGALAKTKYLVRTVFRSSNYIICSALCILLLFTLYCFSLKPELFLYLSYSVAFAAVFGWIIVSSRCC